MPVITYTSVDRGELASGHSAGVQFQIQHDFEDYPRRLIRKGEIEETLVGAPEGWLHALQRQWTIRTDRVLLSNRQYWREFFTSVMNAETFTIDFTGTIAVPVDPISMYLVSIADETQIGGIAVQYTFTVKQVP